MNLSRGAEPHIAKGGLTSKAKEQILLGQGCQFSYIIKMYLLSHF